jgi:hypothetical protein
MKPQTTADAMSANLRSFTSLFMALSRQKGVSPGSRRTLTAGDGVKVNLRFPESQSEQFRGRVWRVTSGLLAAIFSRAASRNAARRVL